MKRIGLVLMAIVAIAYLMPASMAQSSQPVTVKGYVYNGGLPVEGVKVQIYTWDGEHMGTSPQKTTTTQTIDGVPGAFEFKNVPYDSSKTFQYVIQAEKDGSQAHAMVYVAPPQRSGDIPKAEIIILDLSMWDWKTNLEGMVQSGNLEANALPIAGANVTIYTRDQNGTIGQTPVATAKTGNDGKFNIENVLGYGQYQAVVIKDNHIDKVNFTVYKQETHILSTMTGILLSTPTPTATAKPTTGGGSGGFFGIPGFEAVLALAALSGTALYLKKR